MISKKVIIALLLGLLILAYFGNMTGFELRADEPQTAVVSMEMAMNGDLIVPQIGTMPYYTVPPVFNWFMLGCFRLFSSFDEWVVRLPGLLSLLLLAFVSYRINKRYLGDRVAGLSAALLLVSAELLFRGSVNSGERDLFYALICFLQISSIFIFRANLWKLFIVSYALAALGFLSNGAPSIAYQGLTLLLYFIQKRKWRQLFSLPHLSGIGTFFLLNAIYFGQYAQTADARSFLVWQFKEMSMGTAAETAFMDRLIQFMSFPGHLLLLMVPAAFFVVYLFKRDVVAAVLAKPWLKFSILFVFANIWIYWFSGRFNAGQYYMFFPFVISVLVYAGEKGRVLHPRLSRRLQRFTSVIAGLLIVGIIGGLYFFPYEEQPLILLLMFLIVLSTAFFSVLYFKTPQKWLALVALLLLARVVFNNTYIPFYQENNLQMSYRTDCLQMDDIIGDEQVYLYGEPHYMESDVRIGPLSLAQVALKTAPLLPFQIPYYISKKNHKILEFQEEMHNNRLYLIAADQLEPERMDSLAVVQDHWKNRQFILVRSHSFESKRERE